MRSGKPVVEVGGSWTVFSVRGIRQKAEKALQAAGAGRAPLLEALRVLPAGQAAQRRRHRRGVGVVTVVQHMPSGDDQVLAAVLAGQAAPDLYSAATLAGVALLVAADKRRL